VYLCTPFTFIHREFSPLNKSEQEKVIAAYFPRGGKVFSNNKMPSGA